MRVGVVCRGAAWRVGGCWVWDGVVCRGACLVWVILVMSCHVVARGGAERRDGTRVGTA